ncbi:unnamed protein product [Cylindrotheca closterium]|uniref:Uncharacterized protein n=1 Tax=Cylindrotheca closterium TaxID=2856 RepID=A0AAD2PUM2_9STRA|nr:unnamed protein product [Cylindrotheca closterium]
MKRGIRRKENSGQDTAIRKRRSGLIHDNPDDSETHLHERIVSDNSRGQVEGTVNDDSVSSSSSSSSGGFQSTGALHNFDSQSGVASEISTVVSNHSHESLSFIRGKALYNLAQEMDALVDEMELGDVANDEEGPMISGSISDDDLDNLQLELANADQEFGDMFDWDGKSIIVVEAESDLLGKVDNGRTDVLRDRAILAKMESSDFQPQSRAEPQDTNHHPSLISLDESTTSLKEDGTSTKARSSQHSELTRMESNDFQPPAHSAQAPEIHFAPVSLKESTEGLQEEYSRPRQQQNTAFRQLEEILTLVKEENRALKTEMDQMQQSRTSEEKEYGKSMQAVEDQVVVLMKRLQGKQVQHNSVVKQAKDERASLKRQLQNKAEQIQELSTQFQQKTKEEESRRQKLEMALATVQEDLEPVDSVTSDMVQELDGASSMGNSSSIHNTTRSWRDTDSWWAASPKKPTLLRKDSQLPVGIDKIPEALTINHILHMCQSPPKVSRLSPKYYDTPPDMIDEIRTRNEKAVQVLAELKTKVRHSKSAKKKKDFEGRSTPPALDYGQAEPALVNENVQELNENNDMLLYQFDQESDILNRQLSVQQEIIARLETKHKTIMENSRQRYSSYEIELSELKATYDEQLATFANENESLNQKLVNVTSTIDRLKSRHEQEITSLKLERHEIEEELLENSVSVSNPGFDRFKQENESLSKQLVQYNDALDKLRIRHEQEMKAHASGQIFLVEELKKLQSKYERTVGSFHRQKEILMRKLLEKERAISEIEVAKESTLKASKEEKQRLEEQLQELDERCTKMKKERAGLLQAQKKKFELISSQLKGLKAMRDMERSNAQKRINILEEKLQTIKSKRNVGQEGEYQMMSRNLEGSDTTYSNFKSDHEVAVEASDTSRSSCLDPMADEDDKVQETRIASAAGRKLKQQSFVGTRGIIVSLLSILIIWVIVRLMRSSIDERDSFNRKIEALQNEVKDWEMQDMANDVMNVELQHSLEETTSASMSHRQEAFRLAGQLDKLLVKYEALQQEHANYLDLYSEETSHDSLPRCFDSPTLSLAALFEAQLEGLIEQRGSIETQVQLLDAAATPVVTACLSAEAKSLEFQEESPSTFVEMSDSVVSQDNASVKFADSQATVFELSKAGLEAEFFLVENLAMLSQLEGFEKETLRDLPLFLRQGVSLATDMLDENFAALWISLSALQDDIKSQASFFRDRAATVVQDAASKLKNRLFPRHRRMIKSEEGVWLDL